MGRVVVEMECVEACPTAFGLVMDLGVEMLRLVVVDVKRKACYCCTYSIAMADHSKSFDYEK
jgi:hypothetical protein